MITLHWGGGGGTGQRCWKILPCMAGEEATKSCTWAHRECEWPLCWARTRCCLISQVCKAVHVNQLSNMKPWFYWLWWWVFFFCFSFVYQEVCHLTSAVYCLWAVMAVRRSFSVTSLGLPSDMARVNSQASGVHERMVSVRPDWNMRVEALSYVLPGSPWILKNHKKINR